MVSTSASLCTAPRTCAVISLTTATAPTTAGQLVVLVGIAISSTDMELELSQPILL